MQKVERLAYFSMHPADYLLDTADLSLAEHGAYQLMMLRYYWEGRLLVADKYRGCRTDADRVCADSVAARFFHAEGELLVHNRIERELEKIRKYVEHQSYAGKRSGEARAGRKAHKGNGSHKLIEDAGEVLERIPMLSGEEFEVRESFAKELERLYPNVDIPATLKQMRGWCIGNPTKLKTPRGIRKFITGWCERDQNGR